MFTQNDQTCLIKCLILAQLHSQLRMGKTFGQHKDCELELYERAKSMCGFKDVLDFVN